MMKKRIIQTLIVMIFTVSVYNIGLNAEEKSAINPVEVYQKKRFVYLTHRQLLNWIIWRFMSQQKRNLKMKSGLERWNSWPNLFRQRLVIRI